MHATLVFALCTALVAKPPATEPPKPPVLSEQEMRQRIAEHEASQYEARCRLNLEECIKASTWGREKRKLSINLAVWASLFAATFVGGFATSATIIQRGADAGTGLGVANMLFNLAWPGFMMAAVANGVVRARHLRVPKGERLHWRY